LNRYGCRTISIDVSPTALEFGQQLFRRDPATKWDVRPEFMAYDGHRLPLPDNACDKIVVFDAFHHVPNQREILTEMYRILKPEGVVGMSEPGQGHAASAASKREVDTYGVLENELVIEDLAALAKSCGFREAMVLTASPDALHEVRAEDLGPFLQGKGFVEFWRHLGNALLANHHILLYKGDPRPSTRRPKELRAGITVEGPNIVRTAPGASARVRVVLANETATRWLAAEGEGWTRLGGHLYTAGSPREAIDFDWLRVPLPHDVNEDETTVLDVTLPPIQAPGSYQVVFDLVVEGLSWFEPRGSKTAAITVIVAEPGSPG
jgi:hypothetical protein